MEADIGEAVLQMRDGTVAEHRGPPPVREIPDLRLSADLCLAQQGRLMPVS